jgi:Ser/Thr protein kinase RdoA (MazF antagonist)
MWRTHTVADELRILRERLGSVVEDHHLWQPRIERVLDGCRKLAGRLRDDSWCGIHRDFYPEQVLVDGDRLYVTDLDLYARGPAALDIGNFVAHVEEYSLRRFGHPDRLIDRVETLVERYLQLTSATTRQSIDIWATLSLARHIAISWSLAERRPFTPGLIELCEWRILERSTL